MSSSPNAEEGSGSPPLSGNGNGKAAAGALPSSSNVAPNSNGNGHGYPRSGMDSPTNVFRIEQQNKLLLKLMNIEPGQAEMAKKFAEGSLLAGEREIDIITNVYGLNQTSPLAVHTYHLLLSRITERGTYPVIKSKRRLPDHAVVMRRQFYQKVMPLFYQKYAHLFGDDMNNHLVDYACTMFSFVDFTIKCTDEQKKEILLELSAEEASTVAQKASVSLSLKPADADLLLQDHSGISCNLEFYDASTLRFSELATSHYVAEKFSEYIMFSNNTVYLVNPTKHGYSASDTLSFGDDKFLCIGASKSVILIEGPKNTPANNDSLAAAVIDSKKTPFRISQPCLDAVCRILKISPGQAFPEEKVDFLQPFFKGLQVHRTYANTATTLVMKSLSYAKANEQIVGEGEHADLTIEQYLLKRYEIKLRYPDWPLVEQRVRGKTLYFPIELLYIAEYQRLKYLDAEDIKQIIKACAVAPIKKREEIDRGFRAFNINGDPFCQNAGIFVNEEPLNVKARVLSPPTIVSASGHVVPRDGLWRLPKNAKFISTASCQKWIAVLLEYHLPRPFDLGKFEAFCRIFIDEAHTRGLSLAEPQAIFNIASNDEALEKLYMDAVKEGIEFILFGHPDAETVLHSHIKTFERKFLFPTQCVRTSTIERVVDGQSKLTLENIMAKTNVKLGGHNYSILMNDFALDTNSLFIGFGVNHPGGGFAKGFSEFDSDAAVSILGYSANDSHDPGAFIGNFFVQPMFQENQLTVLGEIMIEILERFVQNRGRAPARVVIYRSGCSQGEYQRVLRYEIPVVLHYVKIHAPGAPVTVIVPSILHNLRFFKKEIDPTARAPEQNIPPGTVIDTTVVHAKFVEFYLNSHIAIQGTAKTPRYTIIFTNEQGATLDLYQRWTNALCYDFQIVNSPVSVPAPVYVANCYAERGRQIANNFRLTKLSPEQEKAGLAMSAENEKNDSKSEYYLKSLQYNYTCRPQLRSRRINA